MHLSIVSIEPITPWSTRDMHLEEFPSIWSTQAFLSVHFSKCTCVRRGVLASFTQCQKQELVF